MDELEPFVTAERVADFLGITRRQILQMARAGTIPAHPISGRKRHVWVFRISEVTRRIANRSRMNSLGGPIGHAERKSA
jgi:excisionase family DNA binding protein